MRLMAKTNNLLEGKEGGSMGGSKGHVADQVCESVFLKAMGNEQGSQQPKGIAGDQKKSIGGEHYAQALCSERGSQHSTFSQISPNNFKKSYL